MYKRSIKFSYDKISIHTIKRYINKHDQNYKHFKSKNVYNEQWCNSQYKGGATTCYFNVSLTVKYKETFNMVSGRHKRNWVSTSLVSSPYYSFNKFKYVHHPSITSFLFLSLKSEVRWSWKGILFTKKRYFGLILKLVKTKNVLRVHPKNCS